MLRAWRLVKTRYSANAFDGEGARLYGGRWSSQGVRVAYGSESVALATLEVLAHLSTTTVLGSYSLASIRFPEALVVSLDAASLPAAWRTYPPPPEVQALGDQWVSAAGSAVLRVSSGIVPDSNNYLFNPEHPDFARMVVDAPEPYVWDPRVLRS
jgi:RES domain-containing protein